MSVKIIKVMGDETKTEEQKSLKFSNDPNQYLELLENKNRVKDEEKKNEFSLSPEKIEELERSDDEKEEKIHTEDEKDDDEEVDFSGSESDASDHEDDVENDDHERNDPRNDERKETHADTSSQNDPNVYRSPRMFKKTAPPLSQLEKKKETIFSAEDESGQKRDLLSKFSILRKQYKNTSVIIPDYTTHSNLSDMQQTYQEMVRELKLDSSVENYKKYIKFGSMGIEWAAANWLKLDMNGFYQNQVDQMSSYDQLLYELGEKNQSTGPSRIPVELRLLGMMLLNAAIFIGTKMFLSSGAGAGVNVNSFFENVSSAKKKKQGMGGPTYEEI